MKFVAAGLMLALVASSLFGRRLKLGPAIRMLSIWAALFSSVYVLFLFRDEARVVWDRAEGDISGQQLDETNRQTVRIPMRSDGQFWVTGAVNGTAVEFLIDSGATTTALSVRAARAAGIDQSTNLQVPIATANGTIMASPVRIDALVIGHIRQTGAPATVSMASGQINLLGMSFLSKLKSWKVDRNALVLEQ